MPVNGGCVPQQVQISASSTDTMRSVPVNLLLNLRILSLSLTASVLSI